MTTVSIPYFDLSNGSAESPWQSRTWNESRVPHSNDLNSNGNRAARSPESAAAAASISQPQGVIQSQIGVLSSPAKIKAELSKAPQGKLGIDPKSQLDRTPNQSVGLLTKAKSSEKLLAKEPARAIDRLTSCILERFPIAAPTIILFVGTQSNPLTSATCASVASELAAKNIGNILLVDSSVSKELSKSFQSADHRGLSNLLVDTSEWKSTLTKLPSGGLDFLPAGSSHWDHWGAESRMRQLAVELRRQYQFVCVAADDPQDANSKIWTNVCDGSFLLVSLTNANRVIAESAVVELQTSGARLLGCVVTDADTTLP